MEVSSPQLAQALAAARVALAEAFVLKIGETLQAVVAGKGSDGLTLLKIGEQTVKAALPEGLPTGTMLQLQVKSAGAAPQLQILSQILPQGRAVTPTTPSEPRLLAQLPPAPAGTLPVARPVIAQNGESRPVLAEASSQIESNGPMGLPPRTPEVRSLPQQTQPGGPAPMAEQLEAEPVARITATVPESPAAARPLPTPTAPQLVAQAEPPAAPAQVAAPAAIRPVPATPAGPTPIVTGEVAAPATPLAAAPTSTIPLRATAQTVEGPATPPLSPATAPPSDLVHPLLVAQAAPRPQVTAAELPRPAPSPAGAPPQAAPAAPQALPATPQAALSQMLPEALARQDSAGPLLQSLAALVQKPALLPGPVLRAALSVLAQRIVATDGKVQAAELERAVLRSGLGLEATLAKGEPPVPLDAKAGLLALRAALAKWLGEGTAPPSSPREAAPPPLKGLPLRAPELAPPLLPDAPRDALRAAHSQTDAAVSRIKLMQMASLPDADPGRPSTPTLRLELPLLIGHELVMAQLQVSRDGSRRETERKRGWTMRFALNFSATGEVGAEVGLLGKAVNVALWAAEPGTAEAMQAALPELGGALEAIGLKPGSLRIRHGAPEPTRPASGQLLDSVS